LSPTIFAEEEGSLVLVGEIHGGYDAVDNLNGGFVGEHGAIGCKLHDGALYESLCVDFLAGYLGAEALAESLILLGNHFVGNVDGIVGHRDVFVDLDVDFRCEADFVFKRIVGVAEVDGLHLDGERLAEHVDLVFADIIDYGAVNLFVEHGGLDVAAEAAAELVDAYVAFAEAGNLARTAYFFKLGVNLVGIVGRADLNLDAAFQVAGFFKRNLHNYCGF